MRARAYRRHVEQKRKIWAKKVGRELYGKEPTDRQVGILAHTPELCSCYMCGNPRKHYGYKTLQELRFTEYEKDSLIEI